MDEITRQEYLNNMGIQSYFPRYVLPAALLSEQCAWPESVIQHAKQSELSELKQATEKFEGQSTQEYQRELQSLVSDSVKVLATEVPIPNSDISEIEANEIRFQLAFIPLNETLLALILLPYVRAINTLSQVHKQLFKNICNALSLAPVNFDVGIKPFCWPFSEAVHMDKSEKSAKTALGAYLSQLRNEYKYKSLLLMGDKITPLVKVGSDCEIIACRSLDEMLKMPQLKGEVWQQLKQVSLITTD